MKLILYYLSCLIIPLTATGQEKTNEQKNCRCIGLSLSPTYSFRKHPSEFQSSSGHIIKDVPKRSFIAGLNFNYYLSNKISIESGIMISDKGYRLHGTCLCIDVCPDPCTTNLYIYYLDIPLILRYYVTNNNNFNLFGSVGIVTNIFLNEKNGTIRTLPKDNPASQVIYSDDFRTVGGSFLLFCGIEFKLSNKVFLDLGPIFQYTIVSLREEYKFYPYSFGILLRTNVNF